LREQPRVHVHDVFPDHGVRGLPGLLRHGDQAAAVQDAERLARSGPPDDRVIQEEAELGGEGLADERFEGDRVRQQLVRRVAEADQLVQVQLDLPERRLAGGLLRGLVLPVSQDAAGPGRGAGCLVHAVDLDPVGIPADRDPPAARRQDSGLEDLLEQLVGEVRLDQEAALGRHGFVQAAGADLQETGIDRTARLRCPHRGDQLLAQGLEALLPRLRRLSFRPRLRQGRVGRHAEIALQPLMPLLGRDNVLKFGNLVHQLLLQAALLLGHLTVLGRAARVHVGQLLHVEADLLSILSNCKHLEFPP